MKFEGVAYDWVSVEWTGLGCVLFSFIGKKSIGLHQELEGKASSSQTLGVKLRSGLHTPQSNLQILRSDLRMGLWWIQTSAKQEWHDPCPLHMLPCQFYKRDFSVTISVCWNFTRKKDDAVQYRQKLIRATKAPQGALQSQSANQRKTKIKKQPRSSSSNRQDARKLRRSGTACHAWSESPCLNNNLQNLRGLATS